MRSAAQRAQYEKNRREKREQDKLDRCAGHFMPLYTALDQYIQVDGQMKRIKQVSHDEFLDWAYSLIEQVGPTTPAGRYLDQQLYIPNLDDETFRWHIILESLRITTLRKVMFVSGQQEEQAS